MKKIFFISLFLSQLSFGQVDLNLGLRAYYPFSGNANDVSGNNNNPVLNNAVLTADAAGNPKNAYHFNGVNNYMQVPNSPSLNLKTRMSISLKVKPTGFYKGHCYNNILVMKGDIDYLPGNYFVRFADQKTGCTDPTTKTQQFYGQGALAPTPFVQLNHWYSIVSTCDGTTAKIYIDCVLKASVPYTEKIFSNDYDLFIGRMNNEIYPYWLNGDLDEVRIYNRPLTVDEVNKLGGCQLDENLITLHPKPKKNKATPVTVRATPAKPVNEKPVTANPSPVTDTTKKLVAYFPFNGNANDESGNNNNPVFNNATLTADRFGNPNSAYHFNGINTYMMIPNQPGINMNNQITLSVWVKPTGFYYGICHASSIISKGLGNYMPGDYALRFDDALYTKGNGCGDTICDTLHQNYRGTGTTMVHYTPFINKDKWYAVTYTNDGTTAKLYVDCQLAYAVKFPETFTNDFDLYLGRVNDDFFPFWLNGDLDEVRIYNKALDSAAIFALCNIKPPMVKPVEPVKPVVLEERKKELVRQITVDHDSVTVTLYDNGVVDGDSVTLVYNKEIITQHLRLSEKPVSFTIKIDRTGKNELQMYAENLGSIPPNTALMVIYDGNKRYELTIRSTENTNGMVSFKLKE